MTRYTTGQNSTIICDQCRKDIQMNDTLLIITHGKSNGNYAARDYDKGDETVLCVECANALSQILAIMGTRYADSLALREAA